jgi:uncharacterized protein (DUF2336 family)
MLRLVEASRQIAGMRSPLARHPRLTSDLAQKLYLWVGQSLRAAIISRFRVDVEALDKALAEAVGEAHARPGQPAAPAPIDTGSGDAAEMERRLIGKLHAAGQLRPSYLLRALRERKLSLFSVALATLGDFTLPEVQRALACERPEVLALACAAVGVDKSAFGSVLTLVRELNHGRPGGDVSRVRRAFEAFGPDRMSEAGAAFRKAVTLV